MMPAIKLLFICLSLWCHSICISYAHPSVEKGELLKASFIIKVTKFINWPNKTRPKPLFLCSLGNDRLVNAFHVIAKESTLIQTINIKIIVDKSTFEQCHVLYIALSEKGSYQSLDIIRAKLPILTISELPGFAVAGGIIELNYDTGKIQFDINLDKAHLNALNISSHLLKLAQNVQWDNKP